MKVTTRGIKVRIFFCKKNSLVHGGQDAGDVPYSGRIVGWSLLLSYY